MHVIMGALTTEWQNPLVNLMKLTKFITLFADSLVTDLRQIQKDGTAVKESRADLPNL